MLYSRNNWLDVHIQRCAGMSLGQALRQAFPGTRALVSPHGHAVAAREVLGRRVFNRLYRFAHVRNPWDRQVSWYCMLREKDGPRRGTRTGWDYYRFAAARLSFAEFLQHDAAFHYKGAVFSFATNQIDYISDPATGELLVDEVFRFEDFAGSIRHLERRLRCVLDVPHRNSSRHADYRTYYTAETRDLVGERFARDIAAFGYTF